MSRRAGGASVGRASVDLGVDVETLDRRSGEVVPAYGAQLSAIVHAAKR
jgi:hypothetical protein